MTQTVFKDHFSTQSDHYASYRPSYPIELVTQLAALAPSNQLALDCGCGTGQLSILLAQHFKQVIATDASATQIAQAEPHPQVTYRTALAERSESANASTDLITVAQAAHWLDLNAFYKEVNRIAKPNAILALITYGVLHVEGDVDTLIQKFYYETIFQYWPPERKHVENGYQSISFPFEEIEVPTIAMQAKWNLDELIGYFGTWSAVKEYQKALGINPLIALRQELLKDWTDLSEKKVISWPLSLRIGRVNI